ncbi:Ldh family oxidoreductase [Burkholderia sp. JKS000303]|uniref:Ldh family oxidoreductase n=1 Tax=Burkholderia sp. JKS000303 TaxID=1938747 RepID=UPI000BF2CB55|nr:Ldh family oxidoreductase [Burkholderia sp. JKS000303]PFH13611.1 LDH2 family malate/lactate/ureidoglycolate dehydrogenase [Burkholderia sp. JKS000303]
MRTPVTDVNLSLNQVYDLAFRVLTSNGMADEHARAIARVITAGQRDECHSHGIYRLLVCVRSLREGKLVGDAVPRISEPTPAIVRVDAGFGYSQLAFELGSKILVEKARVSGIAALVINNCFHFSALWPEVEALAAEGLAALAVTPSHSWVAPAGGTKPVFGTNPIAFAWPRPGAFPFVFDFATSAIARGDIELHRRAGKPLPPGWALDDEGQPTTDPAAALKGAMLTFGGHKGSALSAMVELLAGPLLGDLTSLASQQFDEGVGATPCHGELVLAFDPGIFGGDRRAQGERYAEQMFDAIVGQGARLPSQRRFDARARSEAHGVHVPAQLHADVLALIPG